MNENEIEKIWKSNEASGASTSGIANVIRNERNATTRFKIRMGFFGVNMSLATALGIWALVNDRTSIREAWPAIVSLLALWATYIEFIRFRLGESRRIDRMTDDVRSAVVWALAQTRSTTREVTVLLAVNVLLVIPMTVIGVQSLVASGKMTGQQSLSFGLFSLVVLGGNFVVLFLHRRNTLIPRRDLLERERADLESEN